MTNPVDRATDVVAGAAATSPLWYHWLEQASTWAANWLPILGCMWLMVQIVYFLWGKWKDKK